MFTWAYWKAALERAVGSFAVAVIPTLAFTQLNLAESLRVGAIAAGISLLKGLSVNAVTKNGPGITEVTVAAKDEAVIEAAAEQRKADNV